MKYWKIGFAAILYIVATVTVGIATKNFYASVAVYSGGFMLLAWYAERAKKKKVDEDKKGVGK